VVFEKKIQTQFDKEMKIPCHIQHIASRILKLSIQETTDIVNQMVTEGLLEESTFAKNYYKLKDYV
jgi:ABC-type antimicrobial peptide transport system permease subunit